MQLPNVKDAVIDERKLRDYVLSTSHPVGRFKARFFAALGYTSDDWERFGSDLKALATTNEAELGETTPFGQKYLVSGELTGPAGRKAAVVTVWIVLADDNPHLVTVYPR